MPVIARGATRNVEATVHNGNRVVDDPDSLTLTMMDPDGAPLAGYPVSWPPDGDLVRVQLGILRHEWSVDLGATEGTYRAVWAGLLDGAPIDGEELWEVVAPGSVDTGVYLSFLGVEDYQGIRDLLGVELIDLPDATIERYPFAPHAEMWIKMRITNWEDQLADPDGARVLRLATAYLTAALIADGYVQGGTLSHIRPKDDMTRDWVKIAATLRERFGDWFGLIEANQEVEETDTTLYDLPMMTIGGPTRAWFNANDIATPNWAKYPPVILSPVDV